MVHSLQNLERGISPLSPTFEKLQATLDSFQPKPTTELALSQVSQAQPELATPPQYLPEQNDSQTRCTDLCICRCHERKSLISPRWTASIFGQLSLTYSLAALSQAHNCNIVSCQERKSEQAVVRAMYFFPTWFLNRALVVCDRWSSIEHSISVRTP